MHVAVPRTPRWYDVTYAVMQCAGLIVCNLLRKPRVSLFHNFFLELVLSLLSWLKRGNQAYCGIVMLGVILLFIAAHWIRLNNTTGGAVLDMTFRQDIPLLNTTCRHTNNSLLTRLRSPFLSGSFDFSMYFISGSLHLSGICTNHDNHVIEY